MYAIHDASATMQRRNVVGAMCNGIRQMEDLCARADYTTAVVTQSCRDSEVKQRKHWQRT